MYNKTTRLFDTKLKIKIKNYIGVKINCLYYDQAIRVCK